MAFLRYLKQLIGNNAKASILIGVFILILCTLFFRCSPAQAAEVDLRAGTSFAHGYGPVLGLQLYFPVGTQFDLYAGTLLWGATATDPNNWDWHGGVRACRWSVCASIGASYLQRIDSVNGAHTNYNLELSYQIGWKRVQSLDLAHLSDAGTTPVNQGRNAALVSFRLQ